MIDEVFGVKIVKDKLLLQPKLCSDEFKDGYASIRTKVIDKAIVIRYINANGLNYGEYNIDQILINNQIVDEITITNLKDNDEIVVILK